jgi:hypothetical protein
VFFDFLVVYAVNVHVRVNVKVNYSRGSFSFLIHHGPSFDGP